MIDRASAERIEFWNAVADVIIACGGNPACVSATRQKAVVRIEAAMKAIVNSERDAAEAKPDNVCGQGMAASGNDEVRP